MSKSGQVRLTFHGKTFFQLTTPQYTLLIDPIFRDLDRPRRQTSELLGSCDYILATSTTPWFDLVLDAIEQSNATLIAAPKVARFAASELRLSRDEVLDLRPWERASEPPLRVTALPLIAGLGAERSIEEGISIMQDVAGVFPKTLARVPVLGLAAPIFDMGMKSADRVFGGISKGVSSLGGLGQNFGLSGNGFGLSGGKEGLGYLFELDGYPTLMHLADGIHAATSEDDLLDIAELCQPDVLVAHVGGSEVKPLVRAVRILKPKTLILYRAVDPYSSGPRRKTLPMSSFIGAVEEGAPDCGEVIYVNEGDAYALDPVPAKTVTSDARKTPEASS